jgi:hypothetical protein
MPMASITFFVSPSCQKRMPEPFKFEWFLEKNRAIILGLKFLIWVTGQTPILTSFESGIVDATDLKIELVFKQ